jgi:hypothetical protein
MGIIYPPVPGVDNTENCYTRSHPFLSRSNGLTPAGEKQDKSRTALKNKSSGTLMKDGGNPLDPFGGWSMLKKKK